MDITFKKETYLLLGLTSVAFLLRIWNLGDLGFRWDEDLTSITVKAVLEHGYPLLDSGMVYPRFLPLQYLLAGWTSVFGFSEGSLRFPIVIFGTAMVPITFVLAKDLIGPKTAIVAAALIAFDFWQVELSRTARMYAPFFMVFGFYAIAVYRGLLWEQRSWKIAIIPLGLAAVILFDIGIFCALLVLVPSILSGGKRWQVYPYACSSIIMLAFLAKQRFVSAMWSLAGPEEVANVVDPEVMLMGAGSSLDLMLDTLSDYLFIPSFVLLSELLSTKVGAAVWLAIIVLSVVAAFRISRREPLVSCCIAVLIGLTIGIHQFTVAFLLVVAYAGCKLRGTSSFLDGDTIRLITLIFVALLAWSVASYGLGYDVTDLKYVAQQLLEYPRFRIFWAALLYRPLITIFAVIGIAVLLDRWARPHGDSRAGMMILGFLVAYVGVGMFQSTHEHFRYVTHADVFFMPLAALGVIFIGDRLLGIAGSRSASRTGPSGWSLAEIAMVVALVVVILNPARAMLSVNRDYVANGRVEALMRLGLYPDFKSPSEYIQANRRPGDQVLVLEPREYYNYLGPIDGWIQSSGFESQTVIWEGRPHDRYIGTPVLQTISEVQSSIRSNGGRTWIPFNSRILLAPRHWLDDEIAEFLETNLNRRQMTAGDQTTVVLLFSDD